MNAQNLTRHIVHPTKLPNLTFVLNATTETKSY